MLEGYLDGFNLDSPEPSQNRSLSYQHGFANGRADKTGNSRGLTFKQLNDLVDRCLAEDRAR